MAFGHPLAWLRWLCIAFASLLCCSSAMAQPTVQALVWGYTAFDLANVPPLPPGVSYTSIKGGNFHIAALRSDGQIVAWGNAGNDGVTTVPALPDGMVYTGVSAGYAHTLALRSDGTVVAWGTNSAGQCNVPALPAGLTYTRVEAGYLHSVLLRSDGRIVGFGSNSSGQCNAPDPGAGVTYVAVCAGEAFTLALRSDGSLVGFGSNASGQLNVPVPGPGASIAAIAAGGSHALALYSDGTVVGWGSDVAGQTDVPAVPTGVTYAAIAAGRQHSMALTSDQNVVCWGSDRFMQIQTPRRPLGSAFTGVGAGHLISMALYSASIPVGTAFNFSGHLTSAGQAMNGPADLRFTLFDDPFSGMQHGPVLSFDAFAVRDGLFSLALDFGPVAFDGSARWVELAVRGSGESEFTTLLPRQSVSPTPYAIFAVQAGSAINAATAQNAVTAQTASTVSSVDWSQIASVPASLVGGGPWALAVDGDVSTTRAVALGAANAAPGFLLDVLGNIRCFSVTQTSTGLLKDNVRPLTGAVDIARALQGVRYVWKAGTPASIAGKPDIGFIAEDLDKVLPELVAHDASGRAIGIDYAKLAAVSIEAIKEQQKDLDALRRQNEALEARLAAIEAALKK